MKNLFLSACLMLCHFFSNAQIRTIGPYTLGITTMATVDSVRRATNGYSDDEYGSLQLDEVDEHEYWSGSNVSVIEMNEGNADRSFTYGIHLCFYNDTLFEIKILFPESELMTAIKMKAGKCTHVNKSTQTKCGATAFMNVTKWNNSNTFMYYVDSRRFRSGCDARFFQTLCIRDKKRHKDAGIYSKSIELQEKDDKVKKAIKMVY